MLFNKPDPIIIGKGKNRKEWDPTKKASQSHFDKPKRELMDSKGFEESVQWNNNRSTE